MNRWTVVSAVVALGLTSGCQPDCHVAEDWWLFRVEPMRNAEGMPTIEIRAARWTEMDCGPGRRVWIELTPDAVAVREPGDGESLQGPSPVFRGDGRYEYDEVVVDVEWDGSGADVTIEEAGSTTHIECPAAPDGLPQCFER